MHGFAEDAGDHSGPYMSKKGLTILGQAEISREDAAFLGAKAEISTQQFLRAVIEDEREEVAKMIVHDDRLVKSRNAAGTSALLIAVYHGLDEMAALLRRSEVELELPEAVAVGDLERSVALLDRSPELLSKPAQDGFTPLVLAAWLARVEVLEELLRRGADPAQAALNPTAMTPLHGAASSYDQSSGLHAARLLLDAGAPLEAIEAGGYTPLHLAASHGARALVELLLDRGADAGALSDTDKSALELAAERGYNDIVKLLERHAASSLA